MLTFQRDGTQVLGKRLLRRLIYLSNLQDRIYSYKFSKVNVVRKGDSKAKYQEEALSTI